MAKLLLIPTLAGLVFLLASCRSQATADSWAQLEAMRIEIEADGLVDLEEAESYVEAVAAHLKLEKEELEETDWLTILSTAGGSILASFFGINAWRNRSLPGTTRK